MKRPVPAAGLSKVISLTAKRWEFVPTIVNVFSLISHKIPVNIGFFESVDVAKDTWLTSSVKSLQRTSA